MSSACSSPCSSSGVSSASPPVPSASSGGVGGTSAVAVPGPKLEEDGACVRPHGEEDEPEPDAELDVVINNVVCSFSVRCHLNLRDIALRGLNVEYRKESGMVTMKLRRPYTTASMWSSGKVTCTGANSEAQAKVAARRYARLLQKLGFNCRFRNFRVVNVLGSCALPFAIGIAQFSQKHKDRASYEPELHPAVTYRIRDPKATLKIFSTGSITVTAPSVQNVDAAIQHIYPLVEEFKKPKTKKDLSEPFPPKGLSKRGVKRKRQEMRARGTAASSSSAAAAAASTSGGGGATAKRTFKKRPPAVKREDDSDDGDVASDPSLDSDDYD